MPIDLIATTHLQFSETLQLQGFHYLTNLSQDNQNVYDYILYIWQSHQKFMFDCEVTITDTDTGLPYRQGLLHHMPTAISYDSQI